MSKQCNNASKHRIFAANAEILSLKALSLALAASKRMLLIPSLLLNCLPPALGVIGILLFVGLSMLAGALVIVEMHGRWPSLPLPSTFTGARALGVLPGTIIMFGVVLLSIGALLAFKAASKAFGSAHQGLDARVEILAAEREADLLARALPETPMRSRARKRL